MLGSSPHWSTPLVCEYSQKVSRHSGVVAPLFGPQPCAFVNVWSAIEPW